MEPDQPLKVLVSGNTLSIDEVPHEGRVAVNVEEYTVRAIKKGQGTITIAPDADLQLADELGVDVEVKQWINSTAFYLISLMEEKYIQTCIFNYNLFGIR